ncbi:hypothetical protein [uncultured Roseovarius sp.]|uniref:hypothetical protein n=1 Tax=uncultured Roseovarius sp. TaxID=293344 RepID=UPI002619A34E|nr:hypothetical protein [uncultured Roseovarius sp.]
MIICHPHKLIFFKSKKVAGTSFETALAAECGPDCVITPITPVDEETRQKRTGRGAQNFAYQTWPDGSTTDHVFYNHMTAAEAARRIPENIWPTYRKVAITRDPFDVMVSRYYWEGGEQLGQNFEHFVTRYRAFATENEEIAPFTGPLKMDHFLRYAHFEEDINALGIHGLWQRFNTITSKSGFRPKSQTAGSVYAKYPAAADVVAKECAGEIAHFGYRRPIQSVPAETPRKAPIPTDFLFTLTAGRTGSAWLAKLLGQNLEINAIHEPLGIDQFGVEMPDIRIMRSFNTFGLDRNVRDFWSRKLAGLTAPYAETNHTLAKCGLIESIAQSHLADRTTIIVLRRDLARQCASYITRGDFQNVTIDWQWYLSPTYPNAMVHPDEFLKLGQVGRALWYALEMETRQAYYLEKYKGILNFVEASLEEVTTETGATHLLRALGFSGNAAKLPPKANASSLPANQTNEDLVSQIRDLLARMEFDPKSIAASFIAGQRSLSMPAVSGQGYTPRSTRA